jgi:multidrug efflux pump subunit AcrA (membrane-fusion protein)
VFALIASYILSCTLVPTLANYLLRGRAHEATPGPSRNPLVRFQQGFERRFVANGLIGWSRNQQELVEWTNAQAVPTVTLAKLTRGDAEQKLILPGDIQPYGRATVYSRVNGYLKSWNTDIGAHVKVNDVLASIEAPDLDQQLAQARATLASAKANYDIASLTAGRYSTLVEKQAISQQNADQSAVTSGVNLS